MPPCLGLIVNPIAGLGGRSALKGSDDPELVRRALEQGAEPVAPLRAGEALRALAAAGGDVKLLAAPGEMGAHEARAHGFEPVVVGAVDEITTAADTRRIAAELAAGGIDLLLFAGGDGTAVDVLAAVADRVPVLGIPAGVKMHSAVFAVTPRAAADVASRFVHGTSRRDAPAEVMDVDEEALRAGSVSARLHGYLRVPAEPARVQGGKARSSHGELHAQEAIAGSVADRIADGRLCLIGPGTTTGAIMRALGLEKTLLGVDAVQGRRLVAADADERTLLQLVSGDDALVVVTPIGGQGFVLGRGNQQLSPRVIERVGIENVLVVATETKLAALGGRPLLVDTGDEQLDDALSGYRRVVTGYGREVVYRVAS